MSINNNNINKDRNVMKIKVIKNNKLVIPDYQHCNACDYQFNVGCEFDYDSNVIECDCGNDDPSEINHVFSELLLTDAHGIYIPKIFYNNFDLNQWGIKKEDYTQLDAPDDEWYWEAWDQLLNNAEFNKDNLTYMLDQDGDLFARAYISVDDFIDVSHKDFNKGA